MKKKPKQTKVEKALAKSKEPKRKEPLWKGPEQDGITYSMLCKFLNCRERFRLLVVEGLRPRREFNHRIEYGQMWHVCKEAASKAEGTLIDGSDYAWKIALDGYVQSLASKYPLQRQQIEHWYRVCQVQFPLYVAYWEKRQKKEHRQSLLQEQVFDVPYQLPSGRVVRLRGKWDGVDLIGRGKAAGVYLAEYKTKGDIKEEQMRRQLHFDLQTMLYLVALCSADWTVTFDESWDRLCGKGWSGKKSIGVMEPRGIDYDVVRRPLSGGKGSIRQHKATKKKPEESPESFYARLGGIISEDPGYFFMRWRVEVQPSDVLRFRYQCLDPILEQLCDWWEFITAYSCGYGVDGKETWWGGESGNRLHWRHPFGVYNALNEGGASELDEYLASGSQVGLQQTTSLFGELEGGLDDG